MKSDEIKEFGIVIIESLRDGEEKTGTKIFNEIIKYKVFENHNLSRKIFNINTKKEFFDVFDIIIGDAKNKKFPILHFETHGSEDGIQLASYEIVTWNELLEKTRELNIVLKNTLVVILGMCFGNTLIAKINPSDRAPFKAIIGTFDKISVWELLIAFDEFYNNYFFSFLLDESVDKMNQILEKDNPTFFVLTSDFCFDEMLSSERDPDFFQRMVNDFAIREKAITPQYKELEIDVVRKIKEREIKKLFEETKQKKSYFTMEDLRNDTTK